MDYTDFNLQELLDQTCATFALPAREKNLELACHVYPDVPENLAGDPVRLRQIVTNLIGNALKFTERGEVAVRVTRENECPSEGVDAVTLHFAISDTGIGIPPDKQAAVFRAFEQADNSTTRKFGGTGLGLSICSKLVELMGGRIWLESEPGKRPWTGSTAKPST